MEWHGLPKERRQLFAVVVLGVLLLCGGSLFAADGNASSGAMSHKVVSLQHIASERAKSFLTRLGIGTVSKLPGAESLLITGDESDLQKALAILEVVDTRTECDVRELGPASTATPSNVEIADAVGSVCIGTFANPPRDRTKMRAIVDVHHGRVVVIGPAMQLQDIRIAVELGPAVLLGRRAVAAPESVASGSTIAASSMLEASLGGEIADPNNMGVSRTGANHGKLAMSTQKMQEMRRRAAEIEALRQAGEKSALQSTSDASLGKSDANAIDSGIPAGLQHVGAALDLNASAEGLPQPVGEDAGAVNPGVSARISSPEISPKSITDNVPVSAMAQTASSSSIPSSAYEPIPLADGEEYVKLSLTGKLPVIDLLDLVGQYLNLTYLYDPAKVTGEVTLKLNGGLKGQIKKKDLYSLLEAALQDKDLVMTRHKGNIIRVMPKSEAKKADPELMMPGCDPVEAGNAVVTTVFSLKYIDNSSAENLLQGMDLAIGVTSMAESRKIIVTAYAHRMGRIEQLLQLVDQPGAPRKFRYHLLRYTMAKALAEKVKALAEQLESVQVTVGTSESTTPTGTPVKQPGETDAAYRTRLTAARAADAARRASALAASRNQPAQEAKAGVYLDADERTNRILMIGEEDQLDMVDELVSELDVAQQDLRVLQLYRMKYVDAEEVARKLQEMGIIHKLPETSSSQRQAQSSSRITGQATNQSRAATAAAAAANSDTTNTPAGTELTEEGLVGEPQVVVVESTNSLLVNGTPEQHAKINAIIEYVDSEMDREEIPYKVYPLENSSPGHLAEILQDLIEESTEQTQDKDGKIEKIVTKRQDEIAIVPDPNTYSLIVYASKKNQEWINSLIEKLDKRRPQVLIDVTLVEVTKTDEFTYDLNLVQSATGLKNTSGIIDALTSTDSDRGHFTEMQSDSGAFTGFYGDKHINALLTAMQSKNYGRVLAKPKILVNDNEQGTITTKETTYVKTTSSSLTSESSNLVETSTDYNSYDAGVTLDITPHISEGDLLRLDISLERSDFQESGDTAAPPDTVTSEINTGVTVPDGGTIILGGMVKLNQNKGGSKVPILGDIPLIGGLFRNINNSDNQSRLYIFVKAEVIRPEEGVGQSMKALTQLSDKHRMAFEKQELEFQGYQDWPGVQSKTVDPAKVLEVQ